MRRRSTIWSGAGHRAELAEQEVELLHVAARSTGAT